MVYLQNKKIKISFKLSIFTWEKLKNIFSLKKKKAKQFEVFCEKRYNFTPSVSFY